MSSCQSTEVEKLAESCPVERKIDASYVGASARQDEQLIEKRNVHWRLHSRFASMATTVSSAPARLPSQKRTRRQLRASGGQGAAASLRATRTEEDLPWRCRSTG